MQLKDMNQGLFHTPENMKEFQDYLALFSGGEALAASTCAWMAWNLACKYAAREDAERESNTGGLVNEA